MFSIGSKVVHPCYGAGTIVRVQEKSIGTDVHSYYVIRTISRSMQLMVPVNRADSFGLRMVGQEGELRDALLACRDTPSEEAIERDLRARQSDMRERLKSGDYDGVAEVVRTLFFMNSRRALGTVDRQLFEQGKEFLAGELALASNLDISGAMDEVQDHLAKMLDE